MAKAKFKVKVGEAYRKGWGGRKREGWRQSEDALRYRDKGPVSLPKVTCLEDVPHGKYRMVELKESAP